MALLGGGGFVRTAAGAEKRFMGFSAAEKGKAAWILD
jgi:hypothetical protein